MLSHPYVTSAPFVSSFILPHGMPRIILPNNWQPRAYQMPLWNYLEHGGKRACVCWHRRAGKDEIALHHAACKSFERIGTYWHLLPEASQARKAIWEAINPHSGKRRIDEAFPHELRETTRENEMLIRLKSGSTWQVVGSDNYDSLVGSPPIGVTFSEVALANPLAWAYIRPILQENDGWAFFISTPRGRNHFADMYEAAESSPHWFAQKLTAFQTSVFTKEQLDRELSEYCKEYGETSGRALFKQEFECSFDSAVLGAVYAEWMEKAQTDGRMVTGLYDPELPVRTAWDLGYDDATAIWFFQQAANEIRLINYYENSLQDMPFYCQMLTDKATENGYTYDTNGHFVPHDAANKLMAAGGRSMVQQAQECGYNLRVVAATSQMNGIEAARSIIKNCWFDTDACAKGIKYLRLYQYKYDEKLKVFATTPRHDYTSHAADAFEIIGQVARPHISSAAPAKPRFLTDVTANEIFWPDNQNGSASRFERI